MGLERVFKTKGGSFMTPIGAIKVFSPRGAKGRVGAPKHQVLSNMVTKIGPPPGGVPRGGPIFVTIFPLHPTLNPKGVRAMPYGHWP